MDDNHNVKNKTIKYTEEKRKCDHWLGKDVLRHRKKEKHNRKKFINCTSPKLNVFEL